MTKIRPLAGLIDLKSLRARLSYNKRDGYFRSKINTRSHRIGDVVGYRHISSGYNHVKLNGVAYQVSRLAWFYVTGQWPAATMDHKNTIRSDDRWRNLREATEPQNMANRRLFSSNTSGAKGIRKRCRKNWTPVWVAQISIDGVTQHLGHFRTRKAASAVYRDAAKKRFGEFARI